MIRLAVALWLPVAALAQPLSFGVKGGVPLRNPFTTAISGPMPDPFLYGAANFYRASSRQRPYTVSPTVEFRLPWRLSVGADMLYRRIGFNYTAFARTPSSGLVYYRDSKVTANRWDFPIFVKLRLPATPWKPFVAGGFAVNRLAATHENGIFASQGIFQPAPAIGRLTTDEPWGLVRRTAPGMIVGGGIELKAGAVTLAPELRYWFWFQPNFEQTPMVASRRHELDFLLGIRLF